MLVMMASLDSLPHKEDGRQLTVADLITELVRIGNMDAPVWIDGIGALTGVSDDLCEEVILRGSDLGVADEDGV